MTVSSRNAAGGRYEIFAADPQKDRATILAFAGHLPNDPSTARYAKYYDHNPSGPPVLYFARERESGQTVGMAALMMTRLRVDGEPLSVAISGDFSILPDHRGLGPALALQRAVLEGLDERALACAFGCPNNFSLPIIKRVGYSNIGELTRYVKVFKAGLVTERVVSNRALSRTLSAITKVTVDPFLRLVSKETRARKSRGLAIEQAAQFDDERFSDVWTANASTHRVTGDRNAELLNWRYELGTPSAAGYKVLAAIDTAGDRAAAYVVYADRKDVRHVFDLACIEESPAAFDALVAAFLKDARHAGQAGVSFACLGLDARLAARLRSFGFIGLQEGAALHVFRPAGDAGDSRLVDTEAWYFVMGDSDLE